MSALRVVMGCEAVSDVGAVQSGECGSGKKACLVEGVNRCVSSNDPSTGCNESNCIPCSVKIDNAVPTCSSSGACSIAACDQGYLDCDRQDADGCEVHALSDANNCGLCGVKCAQVAQSNPLCLNGACILQCQSGFSDCDHKYSNGCEAPINTTTNCGHCGNACAAGQTCIGGACT